MEESTVLQKIRDRFSDTVIELHSRLGEDTAVISKKALLDVARFLKEDPELRFNYLMDVTAVDYWKRKPRFEVVYHFLSLSTRQRLRLKVPVGEQNPEVDSLTGLWRSADWYEREVYDMYGIKFRNHPNLTRILMYAEFEGHPLRKDYPITRRQPLIGPRD
ncbi:MAG TPA: NADH-quinone oxidoreductase subunit C [Acidobacteriota bacterium]|nr:NADH-quinone oxidoreductase subunit C [Acidobacteriota bacterium]